MNMSKPTTIAVLSCALALPLNSGAEETANARPISQPIWCFPPEKLQELTEAANKAIEAGRQPTPPARAPDFLITSADQVSYSVVQLKENGRVKKRVLDEVDYDALNNWGRTACLELLGLPIPPSP